MNCQQVAEGELVEKYLAGQLEASQQDDFEVHILECRDCLDLLETCEAARSDLLARADVIREMPAEPMTVRGQGWFTPRRFALVGVTVLLAIVAFVSVRTGLIHMRRPGPTIARPSPSAREVMLTSGLAAALPEVTALSPAEQQTVEEVLRNQAIIYPAELAQLGGKQGPLRGGPPQGDHFQVVEPVGVVVLEQDPIFRWQALAGATRYSVAVYDANLNLVEKSPPLPVAEWKATKPLRRGEIFQWQVTATKKDGTSAISPDSSSPQAKFRVLEQAKADQLELFRSSHPEAHLVLGILAADAGLLAMSQDELNQIRKDGRDYELAQGLLRSLRARQ